MTVEVAGSREPSHDLDPAAIEVRTVDATGEVRRYHVSLTRDTIDGRHIQAGKRIDSHDYDRTPDGPTRRVYDVAREHFRAEGFDVYGGLDG